ncbi:MAG: hypothetical protein MUD14_17300 [Hydrococcus sp. Prado102]|jgi:hypothetical protein|nr:hypothetical protein [Hydrococcus sp. Prado102]
MSVQPDSLWINISPSLQRFDYYHPELVTRQILKFWHQAVCLEIDNCREYSPPIPE